MLECWETNLRLVHLSLYLYQGVCLFKRFVFISKVFFNRAMGMQLEAVNALLQSAAIRTVAIVIETLVFLSCV